MKASTGLFPGANTKPTRKRRCAPYHSEQHVRWRFAPGAVYDGGTVEEGLDTDTPSHVHLQRGILLGTVNTQLHTEARVSERIGEELRDCPNLVAVGLHEFRLSKVS